MASLRDLKKEINSLCYTVIHECLIFLEHSPSLNQENVHLIISDAVELRNELIRRINHPHPDSPSPSSVKTWYREIKEELFDNSVSLVERLNNLPR